MKHTVHVTITFSVEVDDENSSFSKKRILQIAAEEYANIPKTTFDMTAVIFESYETEKKKVRKGLGSY